MTAYFGLLDIGQPAARARPSSSPAAAGAVGRWSGQIAKLKGCRVVGIAGGPEKCRYVVDELGFDAAIDYKAEDVVQGARASTAPKGVDVYFDNVGGEILDAVLAQLARHARVIICGAISQYNSDRGHARAVQLPVAAGPPRQHGPASSSSTTATATPRAPPRWRDGWPRGKLKTREDIAEGLESFPEVLLRLFSGANMGKLVLKVAEE